MSFMRAISTLVAALAITAAADAGPFREFTIEIDGVVIYGAESQALPPIEGTDGLPTEFDIAGGGDVGVDAPAGPDLLPLLSPADDGGASDETLQETVARLLVDTDPIDLTDVAEVSPALSPALMLSDDSMLAAGASDDLMSSGMSAPEPAAVLQLLLGGLILIAAAEFLRIRRTQRRLAVECVARGR
jgi:hypothetical protein